MTGGRDYNECRPHSTLNYQTPSEFAAGWRKRSFWRMKIPTLLTECCNSNRGAGQPTALICSNTIRFMISICSGFKSLHYHYLIKFCS